MALEEGSSLSVQGEQDGESNTKLNRLSWSHRKQFDDFSFSALDDNNLSKSPLRMPSKTMIGKSKSKPIITLSEIVDDVSKWVIYCLIIPANVDPVPIHSAILCGLVAGISSLMLKKFLDDSSFLYGENGVLEWSEEWSQRFLNRAIESAVLFGVYESTIRFFQDGRLFRVSPDLKEFLSKPWFE
jgi:hypothetical protein